MKLHPDSALDFPSQEVKEAELYRMRYTALGEKPLYWVGSAKEDLLSFPARLVSDVGFALGVVQRGGMPQQAKPWRGEGPGVFELVEADRTGTYRVVFAVRFALAVYVLHCFQKKSPSGSRTAKTDVELIRRRLLAARVDYEERHGQA